ncbi:MAG: S8 family serine peptidase, partial [Lachnospiraceae bacterium]|nr:S8 family serine peptidase [Lachnospiraceae bacterium]
ILRLDLAETGPEAVAQAIEALRIREDVLSVGPDHILSLCSTVPNDPYYSLSDFQWGHRTIGLEQAWDIETGSDSVTVAVIDSGIDSTHEDLVDRVDVSRSCDFTLGDPVPAYLATEDPNGHGTLVAGIIGAEGNNETDICGVCWDVQLVSYRIIDADGFGFSSDAVLAIDYAYYYNIQIINMSFGWYDDDPLLTDHLDIAISNFPGLAVCAAGNDGYDNDSCYIYPANYSLPNLITVGASDGDDNRWQYFDYCSWSYKGSNYGQNSVDVFAPGAVLVSCEAGGGLSSYRSGTSLSAPYVSGVAALLLSKNPDLTPQMLKHIIMDYAETVYDGTNNVFGSLCVSGGRLNAYYALSHPAIPFAYVSLGVHGGHRYYCTCCNETLSTEAHNWLQRPGGWICGTCGQWTNAIPIPFGE